MSPRKQHTRSITAAGGCRRRRLRVAGCDVMRPQVRVLLQPPHAHLDGLFQGVPSHRGLLLARPPQRLLYHCLGGRPQGILRAAQYSDSTTHSTAYAIPGSQTSSHKVAFLSVHNAGGYCRATSMMCSCPHLQEGGLVVPVVQRVAARVEAAVVRRLEPRQLSHAHAEPHLCSEARGRVKVVHDLPRPQCHVVQLAVLDAPLQVKHVAAVVLVLYPPALQQAGADAGRMLAAACARCVNIAAWLVWYDNTTFTIRSG